MLLSLTWYGTQIDDCLAGDASLRLHEDGGKLDQRICSDITYDTVVNTIVMFGTLNRTGQKPVMGSQLRIRRWLAHHPRMQAAVRAAQMTVGQATLACVDGVSWDVGRLHVLSAEGEPGNF